MIAQDTGSAIVGPARGDVFAGSGDAAGEIAGVVPGDADFFALLPRRYSRRPAMSRRSEKVLTDEDRVLWNWLPQRNAMKGRKQVAARGRGNFDGRGACRRPCLSRRALLLRRWSPSAVRWGKARSIARRMTAAASRLPSRAASTCTA